MVNKLFSLPRSAYRFLKEKRDVDLIRASGLFDEKWYLSNNPDVAQAQVDPLLHYLFNGGSEGRDPGPNFSSNDYLDLYKDVKASGINPLVHYLKYGRTEGRQVRLKRSNLINALYRCSVCEEQVNEFLPISPMYAETRKKYGNPFTFDDAETINPAQYTCPHCGASDRDRLYALYLAITLSKVPSETKLSVLDIAPSNSLKMFLLKHQNLLYKSADRYMEGVDIVIDITNMDAIDSESFDFFICSHVLEHVPDDKKALSELLRILKPGGFGILMVPIILKNDKIDEDPTVTDVGERWRRFGQDDHVRSYSKTGFIKRVKNAGFVINQYNIDFFGKDVFFQCGISQKSVLYIVEKR